MPPDDPRLLHPGAALLPVIAAILRNDEVTALRHLRRMRDHPDPWVRAVEPVIAGQLLTNQGEARKAAAEFEVGLERFRALGERWGIGQTLLARVELSAYGADHDAVIAALEEARGILAGLGDREDVGHVLVRLAHTRAVAGDVDGARRDLAAAIRIAEAIGAREERLYIRWFQGQIERWQGNAEVARQVLDAGIRESPGGVHPFGQIHASMLASRGHLDLAAGEPRGARGWFGQALMVAIASKDRPVIARAVELLAAIALAEGMRSAPPRCSARRRRSAGSPTRRTPTWRAYARPRGPRSATRAMPLPTSEGPRDRATRWRRRWPPRSCPPPERP